MAAKPIEAHQWDFPWGYCPCGWMLTCQATEIDEYVGDINKKDKRYATETTCESCHITRVIRIYATVQDWERIHFNARKMRSKRDK